MNAKVSITIETAEKLSMISKATGVKTDALVERAILYWIARDGTYARIMAYRRERMTP